MEDGTMDGNVVGVDRRKPPDARATLVIPDVETRLLDTRKAFDSVAGEIDGPLDNNAVIQHMRTLMWRRITNTVPAGARVLDLGCGTGIDTEYLARRGYQVVASDWSPKMVERTRLRAVGAGLSSHISVEQIGLHELHLLKGEPFAAIYSNLGPMNCAPDLKTIAKTCAALLNPKGKLIVSVMGRICPWEILYCCLRGRWRRAAARFSHGPAPVSLNGNIVWTRYFTPLEFYGEFSAEFELTHYSALLLFLPPPYLIGWYERWPKLCSSLGWLEEHLGALPWLRCAGDHFLMVLTKHG